MSQLQINLLGAPEISYAGKPLKFSTRKTLALLVYLIVEQGSHSRESLVTLLWPESDAASAKAALRTTLSRLRRSLNVANVSLITQSGTIGFDFSADYHLDLDRILDAQNSDAPKQLHEAIQAYRGGFLRGFSLEDAPQFDHWVTVQQGIWQRRLDELFQTLSGYQLESGNHTAALLTTQRWLAHDPLQEAAHRRLMLLYSLLGNRAAMIEAFETCRQTLADELGVAPAEETAVLYQRLKTAPPTSPSTDISQTANSAYQRQPLRDLPLVGRAQAYQQLTRAQQQMPHLVIVEGDAGVGKTRLVNEFLRWATVQGTDVLRGRAFETGGQLAYRPLIDALRERVEQENAPDDLLNDVWLAELSRILPELRERYPDLPPPSADDTLTQAKLFESVARLGEALCAKRPLLLFIDDVQWADDASRNMLHYLWHRWHTGGVPLLLVLTLRTGAQAAQPQLRTWLNSLGRDTAVSHRHLTPLTRAELHELITSVAQPNNPPTKIAAFADWLYNETAGNPFFIDGVLESLLTESLLPTDDDGLVDVTATVAHLDQHATIPISNSLRQAILTRTGRLGEVETAVLAAATVLGRDCDFDTVRAISAQDEAAVLNALNGLLAHRLLIERDGVQRPYLVAHDKIRDVFYAELGAARRRIYHRRALASLEQQHATAAERAYHAIAGFLPQPAFSHSLAAGDEAAQIHAYVEAISHYENALAQVAQCQTESATLRHLCVSLGRALELNAQFDDALAAYKKLEKLGQTRQDRPLELTALAEQAKLYVTMTPKQDAVRGLALSNQALLLARELDDTLVETKLLWNLALLNLWGGGVIKEAVGYAERALGLARQSGQQQLTAMILGDLIQALFKSGQIDRAEPLLAECRALDDGSMDFVFEGAIYYLKGEFERALAFAQAEKAATQKSNNLWAQVITQFFIGRIHMEMGQPDKAIENLTETLTVAEQVNCTPMLIVSGADLGWVYALLGKPESGFAVVERAIALARRHFPHWIIWPQAALAQLHIASGNYDAATAMMDEIMLVYDWDRLFPEFMLEVDRTAMALAAAKGEYGRLLTLANQTEKRLRQLNYRAQLPELLWRQGQALYMLGQPDAAMQKLEEARAVAKSIGAARILHEIEQTVSIMAT